MTSSASSHFASSSGLPIVASPVNGVPFEIKEGVNGFFSDYGDINSLQKNILKILDNPQLAKKISENNIKKSKKFNWDIIFKKYMQEYKSLLS